MIAHSMMLMKRLSWRQLHFYKKESKLKSLIYDQNSKEYLYRIDEVHILNEKNIDLRTFDNDIFSDITISHASEVKTYAFESKSFGSLVTVFCYIELYRKNDIINYCANIDNFPPIGIAKKFTTEDDFIVSSFDLEKLNEVSDELKGDNMGNKIKFRDYSQFRCNIL